MARKMNELPDGRGRNILLAALRENTSSVKEDNFERALEFGSTNVYNIDNEIDIQCEEVPSFNQINDIVPYNSSYEIFGNNGDSVLEEDFYISDSDTDPTWCISKKKRIIIEDSDDSTNSNDESNANEIYDYILHKSSTKPTCSYSETIPLIENPNKNLRRTSTNYDGGSDEENKIYLDNSETRAVEYLSQPGCPNGSKEQPTKKKRKTSRWHTRDTSKWKRNISRQNKFQCKTYIDYKGNEKAAKMPKAVNCQRCRFKCDENFTGTDRIALCKRFWGLADYDRQKDYILNNVKSVEPKRRIQSLQAKKRTCSKYYYFEKNNKQIRVCGNFFEKTLCISNGPINKAFEEMGQFGTFDGKDKRGNHKPSNKTPEFEILKVKEHITKFPTMESHYCRKTSSRQYLDSKLSILKLYELYTSECNTENRKPVSKYVYRQIFCNNFNLSFYHPKKDQCLTCFKYDQAKITKSANLPELKEIYECHIARKNRSYIAKEEDKKRSVTDSSFKSITIDLQSVLQIPSGDVSVLYYSRKLTVYNATIYEADPPNNAYCILWSEVDGKKGSNEIGTALYQWMTNLPENVFEISIFSDTCSGQNRNQYVAALFLYLTQTTRLNAIEQKYLESGHSFMEVDSMHSAIEHQHKYIPVYSMIDWINIMHLARSGRKRKDVNPYIVNQIKYDDILDLKHLASIIIKNRSIDQKGKVVQWLKVKCLRYEKTLPNIIKYRYDYTGDYHILDVSLTEEQQKELIELNKKGLTSVQIVERPKRQRKCKNNTNNKSTSTSSIPKYNEITVKKAFSGPLPITKSKKNDLLKLCSQKVIPEELHSWFQNLPCADGLDVLPSPNFDDEVEESQF